MTEGQDIEQDDEAMTKMFQMMMLKQFSKTAEKRNKTKKLSDGSDQNKGAELELIQVQNGPSDKTVKPSVTSSERPNLSHDVEESDVDSERKNFVGENLDSYAFNQTPRLIAVKGNDSNKLSDLNGGDKLSDEERNH